MPDASATPTREVPVRELGVFETQMAIMHRELGGNTQISECYTLEGRPGLGHIDLANVEQAARWLFVRFPILQCCIVEVDGVFQFARHAEFARIRISLEPERAGLSLGELLEDEVMRLLDPSVALWRLTLVSNEAANRHHIVLTWHHAVIDGAGSKLAVRELLTTLDEILLGRTPKPVEGSIPPPVDSQLLPPLQEPGKSGPSAGAGQPQEQFAPLGQAETPSPPLRHHTLAPVEQRRMRAVLRTLDAETYGAVDAVCQQRRVSLNSVLSAAMVAACHCNGVIGDVVSLKTAVSVRDLLPNRQDANGQLGCYVAVAPTVLNPGASAPDYDLLALARDYHMRLVTYIQRVGRRRSTVTVPELMAGAQRIKSATEFLHDIAVSNPGDVELADYQSFAVVDCEMLGNRVGGNVSVFLQTTSVRGQRRFSLLYPEPLLPAAVVHSTADTFVDLLRRLGDATGQTG